MTFDLFSLVLLALCCGFIGFCLAMLWNLRPRKPAPVTLTEMEQLLRQLLREYRK